MANKVRHHYAPFAPFDVVRREVIATIAPSDDGDTGPIQAAFLAAGDYIAEHDDSEGLAVEFEVFGRTFRASSDAVEVPHDVADPRY